mmetsp:Transcript_40072/g.105961  ORF Transcript_40072/g.105961 Transcript_40072/m.105961 type:complete len:144 (-) Transcript_40072:236-667(-)
MSDFESAWKWLGTPSEKYKADDGSNVGSKRTISAIPHVLVVETVLINDQTSKTFSYQMSEGLEALNMTKYVARFTITPSKVGSTVLYGADIEVPSTLPDGQPAENHPPSSTKGGVQALYTRLYPHWVKQASKLACCAQTARIL